MIIISSSLHAQTEQITDSLHRPFPWPREIREFGLIAGLHQGANTFFELGVANIAGHSNGCAFGTGLAGVSLSAEYNPFGKMAGAGITAWLSSGLIITLGGNLSAYSDLARMNYSVRPMIGMGGERFSLCYGRNFYFTNDPENRMAGLNTNMVSLRFFILLKDSSTPLR